MKFSALSSSILAALVLTVAANPAPAIEDNAIAPRLVTVKEFKEWLATTDADITYIGEPITDLGSRSESVNTMVTYCTRRTNNVCGGTCVVYNGGPTCLDAPNTQCLSATRNVGFCDRAGCGNSCNQFSSCGTRLDNNFCYTPGTRSINVGA